MTKADRIAKGQEASVAAALKGISVLQADFEHQVKLERQHNADLQRQNEQLSQAQVASLCLLQAQMCFLGC